MNRRRLISFGLLVFVIALVLKAPAALLYGWFAPEASRIRVYGVEGSLYRGQASGVLADNRGLLYDLHWQWHPWRLLLGQAAFDIRSGGEGLRLEARVVAKPWSTELNGLRASGPLKPVLALVGQTFLPVDGDIALSLDTLRLRDGIPVAAQGRVNLPGLVWRLGSQTTALGDYQTDISTEDGTLIAAIHTVSGSFTAEGQAQLDDQRQYKVDLRLRPDANADASVVGMLSSLGRPDAQGNYLVRQSGTLP